MLGKFRNRYFIASLTHEMQCQIVIEIELESHHNELLHKPVQKLFFSKDL